MRPLIKTLPLIFLFIIGYILGNLGIDSIIENIKLGLSNLDLIQLISFFSSIATLILFIAYFIGKYFVIKQMTKTITENIIQLYNDEPSNLKIAEEYDLGSDNEHIYLYSSNNLIWIKIFEYCYNEKNEVFEKGKSILEHGFLRSGYSLKLNTCLPCGMPKYIIQYQRYDYMIGEFILAENGKSGNVDEGIIVRHTFKSLFYYLVK